MNSTFAKLDQETPYSGDMMSEIFSAVDTVQPSSIIPISLKALSVDEILQRISNSVRNAGGLLHEF